MKIINNFVWLIVSEKAKEIFTSGLFDLYALRDDGTETLCESFAQLNNELSAGNDIAIEVGKIK